MLVTIENRSYGADASDEERRAIAERVSMICDGIVLWKEIPVQSVFSIDTMERHAQELTDGLQAYSRVVDLSEAARPNAHVRRRLRDMVAAEGRLQHLALFTQKNVLINVAIQFVFNRMIKNVSLSVHETYEEALQACREAMAARDERSNSL